MLKSLQNVNLVREVALLPFFKEEMKLHILFKIIQISGYSNLLSIAVINNSTESSLRNEGLFYRLQCIIDGIQGRNSDRAGTSAEQELCSQTHVQLPFYRDHPHMPRDSTAHSGVNTLKLTSNF